MKGEVEMGKWKLQSTTKKTKESTQTIPVLDVPTFRLTPVTLDLQTFGQPRLPCTSTACVTQRLHKPSFQSPRLQLSADPLVLRVLGRLWYYFNLLGNPPFFSPLLLGLSFFAPCYLHSFTFHSFTFHSFHLKRFSSLLLLSSRSLTQSFWACVKQVTPLLLPVCSNIPRKDEHSGLVPSY